MGWKKPIRNYIIAALSRDHVLLEDMAGYFSGMEGITVIDTAHMEKSTADKFIDSYDIDIAFVEEDSIDSGQDGTLNRIIEKALAQGSGAKTHFILRYDDRCAEKVKEFGDKLLKLRLPLTMSRLDEREDYIILFQTMEGIIIGKEKEERVRIHLLDREISKLMEN